MNEGMIVLLLLAWSVYFWVVADVSAKGNSAKECFVTISSVVFSSSCALSALIVAFWGIS